jgi:poly-gamma-glutamate synthesis protein (capsule biosynthesis protein)
MPAQQRLALRLMASAVSLGMLLGACSSPALTSAPGDPTPSRLATQTSTPFQPLSPTAAITASPEAGAPQETATAQPASVAGLTLWLHPGYVGAVELPEGWSIAETAGAADLSLELRGSQVAASWIFALATAFPTIRDAVALEDIQAAWRGDGPLLYVSGTTSQIFETLWGERDTLNVRIAEPNQIVGQVWRQPGSWTLLPFDELDPQLKVLAVNGLSPLSKDLDVSSYVLAIDFYWSGDEQVLGQLAGILASGHGPIVAAGNRDPAKLTTVVMTGVTALVRATADTMERRGILYPAQDIGDWLRSADITHISNEVPFAENCPPPDPVQPDLVFCSDPRYMALLEDVGTDVVELTGDHFHDWGDAAMYYTLDLYDQAGWPYYGGGRTFDEGRQAVLLEHNGNTFAFIGCNGKGGPFARADEDTPGAVRCDFEWLRAEIGRLRDAGYLVIATFQHIEYYAYGIPEAMANDFRDLAKAGAVIVSGSQAHHPHGFELSRDSFIHFGLGNTFFDQYSVETATAQGFIDRHVFYDGRHISTELLTLAFVDFARSRPMTPGERAILLDNVFTASGWSPEP